MPVPSYLNQQRRMDFMLRMVNLAGNRALDIVDEVIPRFPLRNKLASVVFHQYCSHLIDEGIKLERGQYEPHALYMRTWLLTHTRRLKQFIILNGIENIAWPN